MFLKTIEMMYQMEKDAGFFQSAMLHGGALRDTLGQLFGQRMAPKINKLTSGARAIAGKLGNETARIRGSYLTNLGNRQLQTAGSEISNEARKAYNLLDQGSAQLAKVKGMHYVPGQNYASLMGGSPNVVNARRAADWGRAASTRPGTMMSPNEYKAYLNAMGFA